MMEIPRRTRARTVATISLAAVMPAAALAQEPPPPDPDSVRRLPEVVVTARNRGESVQDVPLAISAFSGRDLEVRQIRSTDELGAITPNLSFNSSGAFAGTKSAAQIFIRGVGQVDYLPVTDPGVAVYVDGVYMARSVGAVMDLLDVERVEVLRGPQGTLFGRNAVGGAVVLHSRRPGEQPRRSFRAQFGSDRMTHATAVVSGPVADGLFAGVTMAYRKRDGYVTRVHDGLDLGDDDSQAARATLAWRPSETLQLFAAADYSRSRENGAPTVSGGINDRAAFGAFGNGLLPGCGAVAINPAYPAGGPPTLPPPGASTGGAAGCYGPDSFAGEYVAEGTFPAFSELDAWGGSVELTWSPVGWATLRSLTGYRGFDMKASRDADNTPANILQTQEWLDHAQLSQELQVSGLAIGHRIHWQTGLYLFREHGYQRSAVIVPPGALRSGGDYDNRSVAGFAQVTGEITEALSLTLGGRYTRDRKGLTPDLYALGDASQGTGSIFAPTWPGAAGIYLSPAGPMKPGDRMLPRRDFVADFGALTVTAKLGYQLSSGVAAYAGFSNGFKSGGFDIRYPAPPAGHEPNSPGAAPGTYEPETVSSYEVGLKSLLSGGRVRLNLALFRADYDDIQVLIRESFNPITFNGGAADISGAEVEAAWLPGAGWDIRAHLGAMRARYDSLSPSVLNNATPVLPGYKLAKTPSLSHGLMVGRAATLSGGTILTPRVQWTYTGAQHHDAINTPQIFQQGYHLLNASLALQTGDGRWELVSAARNLTNTRYLVTGNSAFDTAAAYVERVYGRPLEWSVTVGYRW
ncbi:TonB-dependent receptor [Candidatus Palauibacter sp.]|uniref:TonB-dependent receptor n=1 Tax=Candidatus Palauibacter sp. TaxID=3101350 RepID=UPI003B01F9BA